MLARINPGNVVLVDETIARSTSVIPHDAVKKLQRD